MPRVPIADFDDYIQQILTKAKAGAGAFASEVGQGVRIGPVSFSCEVVFPGEEVLESLQESSQDMGAKLTTTTEQPITGGADPGEVTTTIKTGAYRQEGTNGTTQGGGSSEDTEYIYDPTD